MKLNLMKEKVNQYDYVFSHNKMSVEWSEARDIGHEIMGESLEPKDAITDLQKYQEDWLTLEAECKKRGELIEKLEKALQIGMNYIKYGGGDKDDSDYRHCNVAISAVEKWRKEQEK